VDAVILTSASAARQAGPQLSRFITLPCYAVGEATAAAAEQAGFSEVRTGPADGAALLEMAARDGIREPLHLCGHDHIPLQHQRLSIVTRLVYAADPVDRLSQEAIAALRDGALPLLHSPRAAALFAALTDAAELDRAPIPLAAISDAVATAAGGGWRSVHSASVPRDDALLELAAKLCKTGSGL
jgi:uroporphyrinogen-III synthase